MLNIVNLNLENNQPTNKQKNKQTYNNYSNKNIELPIIYALSML